MRPQRRACGLRCQPREFSDVDLLAGDRFDSRRIPLVRSIPTVVFALVLFAVAGVAAAEPARGPLRVHPDNPRYFSDGSGRAILLTGSHTWNNLVDMGPTDPPARFDDETYLKFLEDQHHNFFRLWAWELVSWDTAGNRESQASVHYVAPHPWKRSGPGKALDGKLRFDLEQHDQAYFDRLRQRVQAAGEHGIYAAVMLFEGWGLQFSPDAWRHHPFHPQNNRNGIDGDLDGDGSGVEIHTGRSKAITRLQQAYVRKVIETVNDLDNVLYEISNENHPASTEWQYEMIRFIQRVEASQPKQHPVGMTFQYKGGSNRTLFESPADWISPNPDGGYRDNPPAADGSKVIITDTDHLWGIGGNAAWVWKSFLRGLNPIFMDPYDGAVLSKNFDLAWGRPLRVSLGYARDWSQRVDLATMAPHGDLASSDYCLANPGTEYLVYVPAAEPSVTVSLPAGTYRCVWFQTTTAAETKPENLRLARDDKHRWTRPFADDALLHLKSVSVD